MKHFIRAFWEWSGIILLVVVFSSDIIDNVNAGDLGGKPKAEKSDSKRVGEQESAEEVDEGRSTTSVSPAQRPEASIADQIDQLDPNFRGNRSPIGIQNKVDRNARTELKFTPLNRQNASGEELYRVDEVNGDAYSHLRVNGEYTIDEMKPRETYTHGGN